MNEKDDSLSEEFSSFNKFELKRELLDNQSNNINKIENNISTKSNKYNEIDNSNEVNYDLNSIKKEYENDFEIIKFSDTNEKLFEKTFLYYLDNEKIEDINLIMNENIEKVLSITYDDMNIIQRCSYFNKLNSLIAIIKQINLKYKGKDKLMNLINNKNKQGYNALHYSIIKGNYEIYNYLIKKGGDTTISTILGYNNIILSFQNKRTYIFLKEIKYNINKENPNYDELLEMKDKNNSTLLHWAAFSDYLFGIQFLLNYLKSKKNNFKFKNYINYKDNNEMTALQYALMNNSKKAILELTLFNNVDLNIKDSEGRNCHNFSKAMNNKLFDDIIKIKKWKSNLFKRIIFIFLLIIFNALIYFIDLALINIYFLKIIQLSLNLLLIIIVIIAKCINPGLKKMNKEKFNNDILKLNEINIRAEIREINKYCVYCCIKKGKSDIIHCPICDCCVDNFIKHDLFLNICIGSKNIFIIIIYKLIFLFYLLYFIFISLFIIFFDTSENEDITIPLIDLNFIPEKNIIEIYSIISSFLLILIFIFKFWDFYCLCLFNNKK